MTRGATALCVKEVDRVKQVVMVSCKYWQPDRRLLLVSFNTYLQHKCDSQGDASSAASGAAPCTLSTQVNGTELTWFRR